MTSRQSSRSKGKAATSRSTPRPSAAITIQVRNWRIRKIFRNADVTVTCSGGWAGIQAGPGVLGLYRRLALRRHRGPRRASTTACKLINGIYVPIGLEYPVPAACIFQIGAAGTPSVPGTTAIQYQGNALISTSDAQNPATDVVHFTISGQGTGALIGPVAGLIT